jgi:protein-S-isoprenylcysteine O-methyltransferase Ste14
MNKKILGYFLVGVQFGTLALLAALAWPVWQMGGSPTVHWVLLVLSGVVGMSALVANRPGNFNIHPLPHEQGRLVQLGPYRWIRHPMYTAVLLLGMALALPVDTAGAWTLWIFLFGALLGKALLEERWMSDKHADYAGYMRRTRRFVPFLI